MKTKTKVIVGSICILSTIAGICAGNIAANQAAAEAYNCTQTGQSCEGNMTFQVNVVESLTVELTTPGSQASGGINTFLRNDINLAVSTNNASGFTASMYSSNNTTDLENPAASTVLPTLGTAATDCSASSTVTRGSFPSNCWGYSLGNYTKAGSSGTGETPEGSGNSTYKNLVSTSATPITVLTSDTAASDSQDIYFGAKADASLASGTYSGTVIISVVTGDISQDNPITPTNPVNPTDDTANDYYPAAQGGGGISTYNSSKNSTVYTTTSTDSTTGADTTNTRIEEGNTTTTYRAPQGVVENTSSRVNGNTPLATGLAVASTVAATSGIIFFILAKRKKDDDEEEEDQA